MLSKRRNKELKKISIILLALSSILISWSGNIFLNAITFVIAIATLFNVYFSIFTSVLNKKQMTLGIDQYPTWKKFLIALVTILLTNIVWVPTLFTVAFSSHFLLANEMLSKTIIENIGSALLVLIPFATNIMTFYYLKDSIIAYKDYFKAASTLILLCLPVLLLIDSYWPLNVVTLLKDGHSWGLVITAPLFRFLIEIHTMENPEVGNLESKN